MRCKLLSICLVALVLLLVGYCSYVYSLMGSHREKLWLHRCNSVEKYDELSASFPNVEVDIVYRGNGRLDVTHDQEVSFGLPLDSLLNRIKGKAERHLWLDIKNMNCHNVREIEAYLVAQCHKHSIHPSQLIIESTEVDALSCLTRNGWYTSYYVPFDQPSNLSREECDECIKKLQYIADSGQVCALSFPGWWYKEIKCHLHRDIDLLTWKHRTTEFEFFALPSHRAMLEDEQLKVILIKSKGSHHR